MAPILRKLYSAVAGHSATRKLVLSTPLLRDLAWQFVAGENLESGLAALRALNARGIHGTLNNVGTHVRSTPEAILAAEAAITALRRIKAEALSSHLSLKLTQIGLDIDQEFCRAQLDRILECAEETGGFVRIDMEESGYVEQTLRLFRDALNRYGADRVGIVLQSYLRNRPDDLTQMLKAGATVRLVKGGYWESPAVAHRNAREIDDRFGQDIDQLLAHGRRPAIATHDIRFLEQTKRTAGQMGLDRIDYEFQMLYGVREDLQESLVRDGFNVRCYVPYGGQWFTYFMGCVRRLPGGILRHLRQDRAPRRPEL